MCVCTFVMKLYVTLIFVRMREFLDSLNYQKMRLIMKGMLYVQVTVGKIEVKGSQ
jgi:hypothetical protein